MYLFIFAIIDLHLYIIVNIRGIYQYINNISTFAKTSSNVASLRGFVGIHRIKRSIEISKARLVTFELFYFIRLMFSRFAYTSIGSVSMSFTQVRPLTCKASRRLNVICRYVGVDKYSANSGPRAKFNHRTVFRWPATSSPKMLLFLKK